MNNEYREKTIAENTKFENINFVAYDFTKTDLTEVIFKNINFSGCVFHKTTLKGTRFWSCFFDNCKFVNTNLTSTYLGHWGGGLSNCAFEKCKFGSIINASYFTDCLFDRCKIKSTYFQTYLMRNIRFIGTIDDLMFRKFITKEIYEYQTSEMAKIVENRIRGEIGAAFDSKKVLLQKIDLSECKTLFTSFEECDIDGITPPNDEKELLILNIAPVAKKVYDDIQQSWEDAETKSWALHCAEGYFNRTTEIISFYELKHFENEEFAEKLINLFKKHISA